MNAKKKEKSISNHSSTVLNSVLQEVSVISIPIGTGSDPLPGFLPKYGKGLNYQVR